MKFCQSTVPIATQVNNTNLSHWGVSHLKAEQLTEQVGKLKILNKTGSTLHYSNGGYWNFKMEAKT